MSLKDLTVACIGLGRMGSGIAQNVQASGCRFVVHNRTPEKMQPFVTAGAKAAATPREAASGADVVITSLMDDQPGFGRARFTSVPAPSRRLAALAVRNCTRKRAATISPLPWPDARRLPRRESYLLSWQEKPA